MGCPNEPKTEKIRRSVKLFVPIASAFPPHPCVNVDAGRTRADTWVTRSNIRGEFASLFGGFGRRFGTWQKKNAHSCNPNVYSTADSMSFAICGGAIFMRLRTWDIFIPRPEVYTCQSQFTVQGNGEKRLSVKVAILVHS